MNKRDADLWAHYTEMQRIGAALGAARSVIPWTTKEEEIVLFAVENHGSNHATTIFEVYSSQLARGRTQLQLQNYLSSTFNEEFHRQDANQEAATILKYVTI